MAKAKLVSDINNKYFTNNKINIGTAAPTTGTYKAGDIIISSSANTTAYGWICTAAGTPGTWKVLQSATDVGNISWGNISGKPSTFTPVIGTTSTTAFRGDYGNTAYNHSKAAHAPSNAQKNSDITKAEIEAKLTGDSSGHYHDQNQVLDTRFENEPPSTYTMGVKFEFKQRGTVNTPNIGNGGFCTTKTVKSWGNNSGGNSHQIAFGYDEGTTDPYIAVRTAPNENGSWGQWYNIFTSRSKPTSDQVNALSVSGGSMGGNLDTKGVLVWNNSTGLRGYHTNGKDLYHIMGVDGANNIYLGWENQTYININNTTRIYRDLHMTNNATIYSGGMTVNNGAFSSMYFGPNHVRLEYSTGDRVLYVAGSETSFNGYGIPFRAKHLENVENYMKIGANWFTISSSAPGYGGIWFQN